MLLALSTIISVPGAARSYTNAQAREPGMHAAYTWHAMCLGMLLESTPVKIRLDQIGCETKAFEWGAGVCKT